MTERSMPVPEGLAGMRVDAGLARLLGLSRTAAANIAEAGGVDLDGVPVGKSDRLEEGAWLHVRLPEEPAPPENTPVEIEGMTMDEYPNCAGCASACSIAAMPDALSCGVTN